MYMERNINSTATIGHVMGTAGLAKFPLLNGIKGKTLFYDYSVLCLHC